MPHSLERQFSPLLGRASRLLEDSPEYGVNYERTLQQAAELATSEGFACWCTIDVVSSGGGIERSAAAHSDPAKRPLIDRILERYPPSPTASRGIYKVIETGKSFLIRDIPAEGGWQQRADDEEHLRLLDELGSDSYLCVPLKSRGRAVGALMLLSGKRAFSESDLELAQNLARIFAFAVDHAQLHRRYEQTRQAHEEFLAEAAHELRTPLTSLFLLPKLFDKLCESGPSSEDLASLRKLIHTSAEQIVRLNAIVNTIVTRAVKRSQGDVSGQ